MIDQSSVVPRLLHLFPRCLYPPAACWFFLPRVSPHQSFPGRTCFWNYRFLRRPTNSVILRAGWPRMHNHAPLRLAVCEDPAGSAAARSSAACARSRPGRLQAAGGHSSEAVLVDRRRSAPACDPDSAAAARLLAVLRARLAGLSHSTTRPHRGSQHRRASRSGRAGAGGRRVEHTLSESRPSSSFSSLLPALPPSSIILS